MEVVGLAVSGRPRSDVCAQDVWLDKAEVCLSFGLLQAARQLLAEAHFVAVVSRDSRRSHLNFQKQHYYLDTQDSMFCF